MERSSISAERLERTYQNLLDLWTSGVRDYHSLLSDYLTANYIFLAAIGVLLARQPETIIFLLVVVIMSIFGIVITLQMAIVLGRFDAQNALWEWHLQGIERSSNWELQTPFLDLYRLKDLKQALEDPSNVPQRFVPNYALQLHRRWWARRAVSFPIFFAILYALFLTWGLFEVARLRHF